MTCRSAPTPYLKNTWHRGTSKLWFLSLVCLCFLMLSFWQEWKDVHRRQHKAEWRNRLQPCQRQTLCSQWTVYLTKRHCIHLHILLYKVAYNKYIKTQHKKWEKSSGLDVHSSHNWKKVFDRRTDDKHSDWTAAVPCWVMTNWTHVRRLEFDSE